MLVNATEMLNKARAGHYAVGHFNINNLEWTKAVLQTAEELKSPVILGVSEGAGKYMRYPMPHTVSMYRFWGSAAASFARKLLIWTLRVLSSPKNGVSHTVSNRFAFVNTFSE